LLRLTHTPHPHARLTKQKASANAGDGEEQESNVSESEEEDEESEEEEEDFEEKAPADTEKAIFEQVLALRERKLDQDESITDISKMVEALKKENDALVKKEKTIDHNLSATEAEIQEFQTLKQRKLNELDIIVPIQLHQIQYTENETSLPADLSEGLIFLNANLTKLKGRIHELRQEKEDIRTQHKELRKSHVQLIKSREEKQLKVGRAEGAWCVLMRCEVRCWGRHALTHLLVACCPFPARMYPAARALPKVPRCPVAQVWQVGGH
jgi:hypothetical protein